MDLILRLEARRSELGLTQLAVATSLGVSQPHYSKIIGGIVPLTDRRADEIESWLRAHVGTDRVTVGREANVRIRQLARSIEKQLRELNHLLEKESVLVRRRPTLSPTTPRKS